jgi:hypothetical protein
MSIVRMFTFHGGQRPVAALLRERASYGIEGTKATGESQ